MKFKEITNWDFQKEDLTGLLLFIQRLQELSSCDSNFLSKNISISLWDILYEYKDILLNIKAHPETTHYNNEIDIIYKEITEYIKKDNIIKKLLGDKKDKYINGIKLNTNDIELSLHYLDLTIHKIYPPKYLKEFKDIIVEILTKTNEKNKIVNYCDNFFKFLIHVDYQKSTIQHFINITFYNVENKNINKIKSIDKILKFLNYFDLKRNQFRVCFVASSIFKEIENDCNGFEIEVKEKMTLLNYDYTLEKKFFKEKRNQVFLICNNIKAMDYIHAMKLAYKKISTLQSLSKVFFHSNKHWVSPDCLVYYDYKKDVFKYKHTNNLMINNSDSIETSKVMLKHIIREFSRFKKDTFIRFKRAIELHSLSIQSNQTTNQILNLWICLESLLIVERGKTHISIVEDSISLITSNTYLLNLASNLFKLIKSWNYEKFKEITDKLPDEVKNTEVNSLIALLTLQEHKQLATDLLSEMDSVPLIRFKFFELIKIFQNIPKIKTTIEENKTIVKNNIRRLYRVRNKIVHQGTSVNYDEFVVELAHYYIDELFDSIIIKRIIFASIDSIQNFLLEENLISQEYTSYLNRYQNIDKDNFLKIIRGPDN